MLAHHADEIHINTHLPVDGSHVCTRVHSGLNTQRLQKSQGIAISCPAARSFLQIENTYAEYTPRI